jgi:hypothetical protein
MKYLASLSVMALRQYGSIDNELQFEELKSVSIMRIDMRIMLLLAGGHHLEVA